MLRGSRFIILALAGLALVGADQGPKPTTEAEQAQPAGDIKQTQPAATNGAAKSSEPVYPPEYYQPCRKRGSEGNSDLCAQWSAAKAASDAARWAWWQLWLSGLGVFGLGITLWFNFRALDRASEANKISKDNQRARVEASFKCTQGNRFEHSRIVSVGKNRGQTSAFNAVMTVGCSTNMPNSPKAAKERSAAQSISLGKEANFSIFEPSPPDATHFYLFGWIEYECIFGDSHKSYFCVNMQPAIPDPSITHRGALVAVPCKPSHWPKDT